MLPENHGQLDFGILKLRESKGLGIIENLSSGKPEIHPHPAKDIVYMNHLPKESTVTVYDVVGRKIFSKKYSLSNILN